ncbi:MAG: LysR family transcriptional regulator [Polyangiaceae bacterium]|nr:LysR family transcriptional regulator [Polyangiaceae bacterium]MCB9607261.1 LysR family transcriptional regulator [Polyangiaceae bacterium]
MSLERLNFNHLFYFHIVAEEGSIARAAERLRITKPTVSEQVKQLESTLGVKLFARRGNRLELTQEGRTTFSVSRRMFSAASALVEQYSGQTEHAVLRVGVANSVSRAVAADYFRPIFGVGGLRTVLRVQPGEDLEAAIQRGDVDVAITDQLPLGATERGFVTDPLTTTQVVAVVGAGVEHPQGVLLPARDTALRRAADDYILRHELHELNILGETDDIPASLALAKDAECLVFAPEAGIRHELAARQLKLVEELPNVISVDAFYWERTSLNERILHALALLKRTPVQLSESA